MHNCRKKINAVLAAPLLYKLLTDLFALSLIGLFLFLTGTLLFPGILTQYFSAASIVMIVIVLFIALTIIGRIQKQHMTESFSRLLWIIIFVCVTQLLLISLLPMTGWLLIMTLFCGLALFYLFLTLLLRDQEK